jgi:hypothetical protein
MALKLWTLRHGPGGALVKNGNGLPYFYEDKVAAKRQRDLINDEEPSGHVVVAHGPDHRKYAMENN